METRNLPQAHTAINKQTEEEEESLIKSLLHSKETPGKKNFLHFVGKAHHHHCCCNSWEEDHQHKKSWRKWCEQEACALTCKLRGRWTWQRWSWTPTLAEPLYPKTSSWLQQWKTRASPSGVWSTPDLASFLDPSALQVACTSQGELRLQQSPPNVRASSGKHDHQKTACSMPIVPFSSHPGREQKPTFSLFAKLLFGIVSKRESVVPRGKDGSPAATIILLQPWWLKYVSLASEGSCEDTNAHTTADDWEIVKHFKDVLISVFALSLSKIMHSWCRMHQVVHQDVFREEKHTYWWTFRWDSARSRHHHQQQQQQKQTKFHYKSSRAPCITAPTIVSFGCGLWSPWAETGNSRLREIWLVCYYCSAST